MTQGIKYSGDNMKILLYIVLLMSFSNPCFATLTAGTIPVTKVGGGVPTLQNSDITDNLGTSVAIGVPLTVTGGITGSLIGNASTATTATTATSALNLNAGTYINGDACTYTASGTILNCNTPASGTGTVTSVGLSSPNHTLSIGSTPVTTTGTITGDVNWTNINGIASINTGGVNWSSINSIANINSSGINWQNITVVKPINTAGVNWANGAGYQTGYIWTATTTGNGNWQAAGGGSMVYPSGSGLAVVSSGTSWGTTLTAPSGTVVGTSDTQTLTNKRITFRVGSTASSATPTINTDNYDIYKLTAQAVDITSFTTNLSGTANDGDMLEIIITDNGSHRAITWGTSFASTTVSLPTTTVTSTPLRTFLQWSSTLTKWLCVGVA